ncbi:MAG: hypothetical protein Kow0077_18130 [Anaerolineae bacterium]
MTREIPPLAGLCSYAEAARVGLDVEATVTRLVRVAWVYKRLMQTGLYWLNPTPEWEVKEALSLHAYLDADHAAAVRERVSEMRNPPPRMDIPPDAALDAFLDEVLAAEDTLEKLVAVYGVVRPALLAALQAHYAAANPLADHPTRRMLRLLIVEEEDAVRWGEAALAAVIATPEEAARAEAWAAHLNGYLAAAGGISGAEERPQASLPPARARRPYQPDYFPRRDDRFTGRWNFVFPPHQVARTEGIPADEKTLALMCKRALEMDVPEAMARMIAEAQGQPWAFYVDMCRQLWDEARHAMLGTVYFERLGVDWRREIPLHPGFAIRLNTALSPVEAHAVLYTIEQSLMRATDGKRYEWETAGEAADPLARLFQDYDWADEVLHVHIGRQWGLAQTGMSREEFIALGQRKAVESEAVLAQYTDRAPQVNWWPDFVQRVLGKPSAMPQDVATSSTSDPVYHQGY